MNTYLKVAALSLAVVALAACGGKKSRRSTTGDAGSDSGSSTSPYDGPSAGGRTGSSVVGSPSGRAGAGGPAPTGRVLYFEFDSSELNPNGQALADAWGAYLAANPSAKVRLEGHADERGTREYNVGLGERRANSVQQALTARGAAERQITVSSFGEERPVSLGHDDAAWSQNRRVEIVP